MSNVHAGVGAGRKRKPYRIREYLSEKGLTMKAVALEIGVNPSLVQDTVKGNKNNRRVLNKLLEIGVPVEALSLPEDMQPASKKQ